VLGRVAIVAVVASGCGDVVPPFEPPPEAFCATPPTLPGTLPPFEALGFVAHAGGSPDGLLQGEPYTNTREAFEVSYANGYRAFELDMIYLADGEVVIAHDHHEPEYGLRFGTFPELARDDGEGARWRGKYEVMFAEDVIELMVEHPDIWLVLDTKIDFHAEIAGVLVELAPDDSVRDRIVPHLANEDHVAALEEIYPFPERLLAHYKWPGNDAQELERMDRLGVDNIMMNWDRRWSEDSQQAFEAAGYHVWVHSPEDPAVIEEFRARGVGVYTNGYISCPRD